MRWQLFKAQNDVLGPSVFNQLFTMHGTTMVFLVVMPIGAAFANYAVDDCDFLIAIGARFVVGDRVAAVAADTYEIACAACDLIQVEYEELPHVFDPARAVPFNAA